MKHTPLRRGAALLLCLTMLMGLLPGLLTRAHAAPSVDWPQITSFAVKDDLMYNKSRKPTIKTTTVTRSIDLYKKLEQHPLVSTYYYAGEIRMVATDPRQIADDAPADWPSTLWMLKNECIAATTIGSPSPNARPFSWEPEKGCYCGEVATFLEGSDNVYWYRVYIYRSGNGCNVPPFIKGGIENPTKIEVPVGEMWSVDLSDIFEDYDGDELTYRVRINSGEPQTTGKDYRYTVTEAGDVTLVFTANDGTADSEDYTVTLTQQQVFPEYQISTVVEGMYFSTLYMGRVEITVNGEEGETAKVGDSVTAIAVPIPYNNYYSESTPRPHWISKLDHWEVDGLTLSEEERVDPTLRFTMPDHPVSLRAVFVKDGSPVTMTANHFAGGDLLMNVGKMAVLSTYDRETKTHGWDEVTDVVEPGALIEGYSYVHYATYNEGYYVKTWEVTNLTTGEPVDVTYSYYSHYETGCVVEFTVDGTSSYLMKAIFVAKDYGDVSAIPATLSEGELTEASEMGNATAQLPGGEPAAELNGVLEMKTVALKATPHTGYLFQEWRVLAENGETHAVTDVEVTDADKPEASFIMPDTGRGAVRAHAVFAKDPTFLSGECALTGVTLLDDAGHPVGICDQDGTAYTVTLPAGTDPAIVADLVLKLTCSDKAAVTRAGDDAPWPNEGRSWGKGLDTPVTFTVCAENGDTRDYTITVCLPKSSDKTVTGAALLHSPDDTIPFATGTVSGNRVTIVLPEDTEAAVLQNIGMKFLKLTYPDTATAAQENGYADGGGYGRWSDGTIMCNMSLNTPCTFIITAEDGSTKEYAVEIRYTAPDAPTLSRGSAERTGKTAATVTFTTNEAGSCYYKVVAHGAQTPVIATAGAGIVVREGENQISLTNLTEDARDVYLVVKNAGGAVSLPLKVEIPAYGQTPGTGEYTISIHAPAGGTIVPNRTKASAGDVITLQIKPDNGYQMVAGSLTYTLAVAGGETVRISDNRFTMPACDVSITCQWKTAVTATGGIVSFTISGVAGTIDHATNTITLMMPYGTDVTDLRPVITTIGVTSIRPKSGKSVDFSAPVIYTATLEDGTTRRYTVSVYVSPGTTADKKWEKLTDFYNQVPWWKFAEKQRSKGLYPRYW